jgi:hypothetical protein
MNMAAKKAFTVNRQYPVPSKIRYIPVTQATYNGVAGEIWETREQRSGCWFFIGHKFHPGKATRNDIAE